MTVTDTAPPANAEDMTIKYISALYGQSLEAFARSLIKETQKSGAA